MDILRIFKSLRCKPAFQPFDYIFKNVATRHVIQKKNNK